MTAKERKLQAKLVQAAIAGENVNFCTHCKVHVFKYDSVHMMTPGGLRCSLFTESVVKAASKTIAMCRCGHTNLQHDQEDGALSCRGSGFENIHSGYRRVGRARHRRTVPTFKTRFKCNCTLFRPAPTRPKAQALKKRDMSSAQLQALKRARTKQRRRNPIEED